MSPRPCILLYDDGELAWMRTRLDALALPLDHVRAGDVDDLRGPYELIVTTAAKAAILAAVRDLRERDCVSVCAHREDGEPLRERLRSLGFDFLAFGRLEPTPLARFLQHELLGGCARRETQPAAIGPLHGAGVVSLSGKVPIWVDEEGAENLEPPEIVLADLEQRSLQRIGFRRDVVARQGRMSRRLLGLDLSVRGMRVAPASSLRLGNRLEVELRGHSAHRVRVRAIVARDDGEGGVALRFLDNDTAAIDRLGGIVDAGSLSERAETGA